MNPCLLCASSFYFFPLFQTKLCLLVRCPKEEEEEEEEEARHRLLSFRFVRTNVKRILETCASLSLSLSVCVCAFVYFVFFISEAQIDSPGNSPSIL